MAKISIRTTGIIFIGIIVWSTLFVYFYNTSMRSARTQRIQEQQQSYEIRNEINENAMSIREFILWKNSLQIVYNAEAIGGGLSEKAFVIAVQVHNSKDSLSDLVESLKRSHNITKALVIFSHDYFDEKINAIVRTIRNFAYMQIFYPCSNQMHPYEFPGRDPYDCPKIMFHGRRNCNSVDFPDLFGHYREVENTQAKHHWLWMTTMIFEKLKATRDYNGWVLILEEDQYVLPDFLHVLKVLDDVRESRCEKCRGLSLGSYENGLLPLKDWKMIQIEPWSASTTLAFNRTFWRAISNCADYFCLYDDYNWNWSLMNVMKKCLHEYLYVVSVERPRVTYTGECGMHQNCNTNEANHLKTLMENEIKGLEENYSFPSSEAFTVKHNIRTPIDSVRLEKHGGWSDPRDHQLCLDIIKPSIPSQESKCLKNHEEI